MQAIFKIRVGEKILTQTIYCENPAQRAEYIVKANNDYYQNTKNKYFWTIVRIDGKPVYFIDYSDGKPLVCGPIDEE